jgi:AcrR family transcriptional regulator
VPKVVDHEVRRRELADALVRVVVRDGIDAVSIRAVAAEAGCSIRPVQYYFADKAELVAAAHARVSERMRALVTDAVRALGDDPPAPAVVRAMVHAFLPTTEQARDAVIAYHCFFAAELTDPSLRIAGGRRPPNDLARAVRTQLARHRGAALPKAAERDVALLVLSISTLAGSVIAGYQDLREAIALLDHQIDRLLAGRAG